MSFLGRVEGRCPAGCEAGEFEVWSFVRGDLDDGLRLALLAGELNLVMCDGCSQPFFPDATLIYSDPRVRLLAFVFPESYKADEPKWRAKMAEDFAVMRGTLGPEMPLDCEPEIYFGYGVMRDVLQGEDDREDEAMVAAYVMKELNLVPFNVDPAYARRLGLPRFIPLAGPRWSPEAATQGVEALLKANDRLVSFSGWRKALAEGGKPPAAPRKA